MQHNLSPELSLRSPGPPESLRRLAIPDCAPPYDDEAGQRTASASDCPADADVPRANPRPAADRPQKPGGPGGPRPGGPRPGPGGWPSHFAQALAETLAGSRPARQLAPWTTEQTRQRIAELSPLLTTGLQPKVRRIMTSVPRSGVIELTAVVGFGPRVRVLAVRLEQVDRAPDRWRCTAIESA
jgi:Family of unknown function (DUF6459)